MRRILVLAIFALPLLAWPQTQLEPAQAVDSSFAAFIPQWERAQSGFINGNPTLWKANSSHGEDVTIFGAFGGSEKGWKEVGARYDWASGQFKESGATQTITYLNTSVSGDLAYTVAIERQVAQVAGQASPTPRALRVTQVFRKEAGAWKLLHRHADPLVERLPPSERR